MRTLKARWRLLATVAAVALAASIAGAGVAVASFSDTAGSPFATQIDNIANAGCASGFPDGSYHPTEAVNRQQMAAFLNRCGGRAGQDSGSDTVVDANSSFPITAVSSDLDAGAAVNGTHGFAVFIADANVALDETATACPCELSFKINVAGCTTATRTITLDNPNTAGDNDQSVSVTEVCPINGNQSLTGQFQIVDMNDEGAANPNVRVKAQMATLYFPFGPHGTNAIT